MKLKLLLYFFIASAGISVSSYYFFINFDKDIEKPSKLEKKEDLKTQNDIKNSEVKNNLENKTIKEPIIEVFRVEPNGNFIIAGSGEPHSKIILKENDYILNFVNVDNHGKWLIVSQQPLSEGDHLLILEQQNKEGTFILSKDIFVTKIYENKTSKPLVFNLPNKDSGKLKIIQNFKNHHE